MHTNLCKLVSYVSNGIIWKLPLCCVGGNGVKGESNNSSAIGSGIYMYMCIYVYVIHTHTGGNLTCITKGRVWSQVGWGYK